MADFCGPVISQKVRNSCHHGMARAGVVTASVLSALGHKRTFRASSVMSARAKADTLTPISRCRGDRSKQDSCSPNERRFCKLEPNVGERTARMAFC